MIDITVSAENLENVQTYLSRLSEESFPTAKRLFQEAGFNMDAKVKDNARTDLKVRTGSLRRSIGSAVTGTTVATLQGSLYSAAKVGGTELKYAPIHEYGGTVRAIDKYMRVQGGPYLNIPADANKTPAGVTRMQAREVFNAGGYIAGKSVYLNGERMFSLVKQVSIPARLGMRQAAEDEVETLLGKLADAFGGE